MTKDDIKTGTVTHVYLCECPHCSASVIVAVDEFGDIKICDSCGRIYEVGWPPV